MHLRTQTLSGRPLRPCLVGRPPARRAILVRFQTEHASVSLPLDYYKCLDLNRGASKEAVRKACERLVQSPPAVGYSDVALYSRAVLLQNAAECLANMDARKAYEAQRRHQGPLVPIAPSDLPGALALMQECGEANTVIDLGSDWLADRANAGGVDAADVAAAVALAHCDQAADAFVQYGEDEVAPACHSLRSALQLLQQYGLSAQLQQQITQTLEVRREAARRLPAPA